MFYEVSGYCSQGSDHHRFYCCLLFPKSFYFDFQVLVLSDFFHCFLIDSAISWYCHINQPHLLLFNHCYIWYVISQMFVCLNFKVLKYYYDYDYDCDYHYHYHYNYHYDYHYHHFYYYHYHCHYYYHCYYYYWA